jgi:DNA-binding XRE family transcriptional regulator
MRTNLRLLRAKVGLSAEALGKEIGFAKHYRFIDLEYGRGTPKLDEIEMIARFFEITIDDLLYKKARLIFE